MKNLRHSLFLLSLTVGLCLLLFCPEEPTEAKEVDAQEPYEAIIDRHLERAWKKAGVRPKLCDDATFLRRLSLDVLGAIPDAEEVVRFLKERDRDKRKAKVDETLVRTQAAYHWGTIWTDILLGGSFRQNIPGVDTRKFHAWVREAWKDNMPWDRFVHEILTAEGAHDTDGPVSYHFRYSTDENLAGNVSRHFLGLRIQCAQCHDHPYEDWSREDFYGMVAFFTRTDRSSKQVRKGDQMQPFRRYYLKPKKRGEARLPDTLKKIPPRFLTGTEAKPDENRRLQLARFVAQKKNPWFERAIVNRLWGHYIGRGFIEPVDDIGGQIPDQKKLFEKLCRELRERKFDLRELVTGILKSKAYQVRARLKSRKKEKPGWFASRPVRPLSATQLFMSVLKASGLENVKNPKAREQLERQKDRLLKKFVYTFGDDEEMTDLAFNGTMPQALLLMNGGFMDKAVTLMQGDNLWKALQTRSVPDRIRWLFLNALSRLPSRQELRIFVSVAARENNQKAVYEDIFWALLNSSEFIHNH